MIAMSSQCSRCLLQAARSGTRWPQLVRRRWPTSATRNQSTNDIPVNFPPLPPNFKARSRIRPWIWATAFLGLGLGVGYQVSSMLLNMGHVEPNSLQAKLMLKGLQQQMGAVVIGEGWEEVNMPQEEGNTLLNETLDGVNGVITPRAFWNEKEKAFMMLVFYGQSVCGWPTIAHGGCSATVLLEGMTRAINCYKGRDQSTKPPDPSHMGLTYLKPVNAPGVYILKAKVGRHEPEPDTGIEAEKDLAKKVHGEHSGIAGRLNQKYEVLCTIENRENQVAIKAVGIWDIV